MMTMGERLRRKKNRAAAEISATKPGKRQGKDRRGTNKPEDARKNALEARCKQSGRSVTPEQLTASASPLRGSAVGLCIEALADAADHARLWQTWCDVVNALEAWRMRNTGQTGHPKCATIAMMPDDMQTDQSATVDLRTPAERDAAAKRRADDWERIIRTLPPQLSGALRGARYGFLSDAAIWRDGEPTEQGRRVVMALRKVMEVQDAW